MSKSAPLRKSNQVTIAPPAPSAAMAGDTWSFPAVLSGTLTAGSLGHAATAVGAAEPSVATTTRNGPSLLAPGTVDPLVSAAHGAPGTPGRRGSSGACPSRCGPTSDKSEDSIPAWQGSCHGVRATHVARQWPHRAR